MYEINIDCLIEFKLALEKEMEVKEVKEDNKKVDMMED